MFVVSPEGDTLIYRIDTDAIIHQVFEMEEQAFLNVVVARLMGLGYTVIAP